MDFHTKLLLTLTLFSMLVLIGGIIFHLIEMNDKFNTLVTANIALDGQLNNQIQVNRQLLLERDLSAVQIIMRTDELAAPSSITIAKNGKYQEIKGYEFSRTPTVTHRADDSDTSFEREDFDFDDGAMLDVCALAIPEQSL